MKKIGILFLALVMVFAFTLPAAAAGFGPGGGMGSNTGVGPQGSRGALVIVGTITDLGTNSVTIDVVRGSRLGQSYLGTNVTATVTPQTLFFYRDGTTITVIKFADLQVGQQVSAMGTVTNNVWTISRITVGALLLNCMQ